MLEVILGGFIFIFGITVGSFLNVCIYRIPRKESIVTSRSHCTACGAKIKDYDLIPVISFILLGGKCRSCKAPINARYITIELLCGMLWVLIYMVMGLSLDFVFICLLTAVLLAVSAIDFEHTIIPDEMVISLLILGIIYNIAKFDLWFSIHAAIGFLAASVPLYIMMLITKGGMGGGDIKLMAVCGLFVGWANILLAMFLGAVFACFYVVIMKLAGKRGNDNTVVFGPFLSIGILLSALWGNQLISAYMMLFEPF